MKVIYRINDEQCIGDVVHNFMNRERDKGVYIRQKFGERWIPAQNIVRITIN